MARLVAMLTFAFSTLFLSGNMDFAEGLGICWGRQASQKFLPSMVVDMILANNFNRVKLYNNYDTVYSAFQRSDIDIMLTIPNQEIDKVRTMQLARDWVQKNCLDLIKADIKITHVLVGNEPYTVNMNNIADNSTSYIAWIVTSLRNLQEALKEVKDLQVKATIPHYTDILNRITKPSDGDFNEKFKDEIQQTLSILQGNDAPFMINIYPMLSLYANDWPLDFGFFDGQKSNKSYVIKDGNYTYTNAFDAIYDTVVSALMKNGYPNMKIIVGQVGWPTDGDMYANNVNAKNFYDGLLEKMAKKQGTPLRQEPLEVNLYSLSDENSKSMNRSGSERHYGLYNYDGKPKFKVDLELKGNKNFELEPATGISFMPKRWCVLNTNHEMAANPDRVQKNFDVACSKADCSSLTYGSSCHGKLDFAGNVSYAFNSYFQSRNQKVNGNNSACDFEGLGMVINQDPSQGTCKFSLQILSTVFIGGQEDMRTLANVERVNMASWLTITVPLIFSIFFCLKIY